MDSLSIILERRVRQSNQQHKAILMVTSCIHITSLHQTRLCTVISTAVRRLRYVDLLSSNIDLEIQSVIAVVVNILLMFKRQTQTF